MKINIKDVSTELERRMLIIERILKTAKQGDVIANEHTKDILERDYSDLKNIYDNPKQMIDLCAELVNDLLYAQSKEIICGEPIQNSEWKEKIKSFYLTMFSPSRSIAIVNLLQPLNTKAYQKEEITSLQFEKGEILKGFSSDTVQKDSLIEIEVKTLFWINKLAKLIDLKQIEKLKAKPVFIDENKRYIYARKRVEILEMLENLGDNNATKLKSSISNEYEETFGVKIEDDISDIKDLNKLRRTMYGIKNIVMTDLMTRYFREAKRGKELPGVQAMGVTKNITSLTDYTGAYMAVIRLKGYTSNIYLHTPDVCYAEAVQVSKANNMQIRIPKMVYSSKDQSKVIPINVICKVEKSSRRHKLIQEERKAKPTNEALIQADVQIKSPEIKSYAKSNWPYETVKQVEKDKLINRIMGNE